MKPHWVNPSSLLEVLQTLFDCLLYLEFLNQNYRRTVKSKSGTYQSKSWTSSRQLVLVAVVPMKELLVG